MPISFASFPLHICTIFLGGCVCEIRDGEYYLVNAGSIVYKSCKRKKKWFMCQGTYTAVCLSNRHWTRDRLQTVQQVRRESKGHLDFKSLFDTGPLIAMANLVAAYYFNEWKLCLFINFKSSTFIFPSLGSSVIPEDRTLCGAFKSTELLSLHLIFFW